MCSIDFAPFECPICFGRYGGKYTPTTLLCGHSCCLLDAQRIAHCPICRTKVTVDAKLMQPSYSLRDGSIVFWSLMVELGYVEPEDDEDEGEKEANMDASVATSSNVSVNTGGLVRTRSLQEDSPSPSLSDITHEATRQRSFEYAQRSRHVTERKSCGHECTVSSLTLCCYCIDRRPFIPEGTYETYVDGVGWQHIGNRDLGYCPPCKRVPIPQRRNRTFETFGLDFDWAN